MGRWWRRRWGVFLLIAEKRMGKAGKAAAQGFPEADGKVRKIGPDAISQDFARSCRNAGIFGLHLHNLRHEATRRLSEKGFDTVEVRTITGHKTLQMSETVCSPDGGGPCRVIEITASFPQNRLQEENMASSMEAVQKILQETIAPSANRIEIELAGVKADVKALQSEIRRLDDKTDTTNDRISSLRNEMLSEIRRVDPKIDLSLEFRERLAALEAKVASH